MGFLGRFFGHGRRDLTEQKIPCTQRGAMILPRTAKQTNGLCVPCYDASSTQGAELPYRPTLNSIQALTEAAQEEGEVGYSTKRPVAVTFRANVPPATRAVFLTGTFNEWNASVVALKMVRAGEAAGTVILEDGTKIQYKYTCGSWQSVEKNADHSEMSNRQLTVCGGSTGSMDIVDTVATWADCQPSIEGVKRARRIGTISTAREPVSVPEPGTRFDSEPCPGCGSKALTVQSEFLRAIPPLIPAMVRVEMACAQCGWSGSGDFPVSAFNL
jgi:hypothetical protein